MTAFILLQLFYSISQALSLGYNYKRIQVEAGNDKGQVYKKISHTWLMITSMYITAIFGLLVMESWFDWFTYVPFGYWCWQFIYGGVIAELMGQSFFYLDENGIGEWFKKIAKKFYQKPKCINCYLMDIYIWKTKRAGQILYITWFGIVTIAWLIPLSIYLKNH